MLVKGGPGIDNGMVYTTQSLSMSPNLSFHLLPKHTVYPKKYAHGFVVLCFVVVMQSFIMNSHEVFIHIHQGCFAGTGAIVRLPQCQWSKPDGYAKISQCITTTKAQQSKNRVHISWDILYYSISHAATWTNAAWSMPNKRTGSFLMHNVWATEGHISVLHVPPTLSVRCVWISIIQYS